MLNILKFAALNIFSVSPNGVILPEGIENVYNSLAMPIIYLVYILESVVNSMLR